MSLPADPNRLLLVDVNGGLRFLNVTPSLGLLSLATYLRRARPELQIEILDQKLLGWDSRKVAHFATERRVGLLGLSVLSMAASEAAAIARHVKRISPAVRVVVGGPHPTVCPEDSLQEPALELALRGEAEITFERLIGRLRSGGDLSDIPGIVWRDRGRVVLGPSPEIIENLDDLPIPDWSLLPPDPYWRVNGFSMMGRRRYLPLMTSRGCPFGCTYCHDVLGRGFRARSPDSVLAELHALSARYGVQEFEILDDVFNLQVDRAMEILERIRLELPGTRLLFPNGLRADLLTPALIAKLRSAGTYYSSFAVESASPRIQRLIKKNLDLEKTRENIALCAEAGLFCNGYFMVGFPTETMRELRQTIEFALRSPLHQASFFRVTPYEGTVLRASLPDEVQQRLDRAGSEGMHHHSPQVNLGLFSDRELRRANREALLRFYFDPFRILRSLRAHPRPIGASVDFFQGLRFLSSE